MKKPFTGKKEVSAVYPKRNQGRAERRPMVRAVMIPKLTSDQPRSNQLRGILIYIGVLGPEKMSLSLTVAENFLMFLYLESEEALLTTHVWL